MRPTKSEHCRALGFTLVEMTVSIALIGLLAMAAIPLLRLPLEAWMDATRRTTLTTEMDLIHTKLQDDMARALPGSIRIRPAPGGRLLLEYLEVRASGRYRATSDGTSALQCPLACTAGANDLLEAGCPESCFVNISPWEGGTPPTLAAADTVVINPTGPTSTPYANGAGRIRTPALAVNAAGRVNMTPHTFTSLSPLRRFYIVTGPVTYECNPVARTLTRYWNYNITPAQPAGFGGATRAVLSSRVRGCDLRYQTAGTTNQGGLVNVLLRLGQSLTEPDSSEVAYLQATFAVSEGP